MYRIANGNKNGLEAPSLVVIDDGNELVYILLLNFRVRSWSVVSDSSIFLASSNVAKNSRHSSCDLKESQHVLPVNLVSSARLRGVNKRPTIAVRNSSSVLLSLWILVVVAFINIPSGSTTTLDCLRVRIEGENV